MTAFERDGVTHWRCLDCHGPPERAFDGLVGTVFVLLLIVVSIPLAYCLQVWFWLKRQGLSK